MFLRMTVIRMTVIRMTVTAWFVILSEAKNLKKSIV